MFYRQVIDFGISKHGHQTDVCTELLQNKPSARTKTPPDWKRNFKKE